MSSSHKKDTEFLQTACREVWWTCSKLPTGKQVSAASKQEMVKPTEGDVAGYSISKRIFSSKHPAIQKVNEVFRRIDELRDHYTIVKSASATSEESRFQVEPGRRIIRVADIEEFEGKFKDLQTELQEAVSQAAYCINNEHEFDNKPCKSIKQMDKERLARSYDEKDYPNAKDLELQVKVTMPQYGQLKPDTLLPPAVLKRECDRVNQELGDTVALATNRVAETLIESLTTLARNLSKKTILDPVPGDWRDHLIRCYPVEVSNILETRQDRSIPKGSIKLELSWKEADEDGGTTTVKKTSPVMTREEYHKFLRPVETDEKRQMRSGSIDNLNNSLECLARVRAMLGDDGAAIENSLKSVKELLASCSSSGDSQAIAKELKTNAPVATMLHKALSEAATSISDSAEKAISGRRKLIL